jgi:hypothetical protein
MPLKFPADTFGAVLNHRVTIRNGADAMNRRRITLTLGAHEADIRGRPQKHAKRASHVGGLALGLGVGAAVIATPWIASADPFTPFDPNNIAISIDGMTIFQQGTAHASSGIGDIAFADGANSDALAAAGNNDFAFADGANSVADAGGGNYDVASVIGLNSSADAAGGNNDFASVFDLTGGQGSWADAVTGNNDFAIVVDLFGNLGSGAAAGGGANDIAAVFADGLTANAFGNWMIDILPSFLTP